MNSEISEMIPLAAAPFLDFFIAIRLEICLFFVAMLTYFTLFSNVSPSTSKQNPARTKRGGADDAVSGDNGQSSKTASDNNDPKIVMKNWNVIKRADKLPSVSLAQVVESMQRLKREPVTIVRELKTFITKHASELDMACINELLEYLARRMDSTLMDSIVGILDAVGLPRDSRSYEIFLSMHFAFRDFQAVQQVVAEMLKKGIEFNSRSLMVIIKTKIKTGRLQEARAYFRELKPSLIASTPSSAPSRIVSQLVDLACKEHQLKELLSEFSGVPLGQDSMNSMLGECIHLRDTSMTSAVETLIRGHQAALSDRIYTLLLKGFLSDAVQGLRVVDEVLARSSQMSSDVVVAAIAVCAQSHDVARVEQLLSLTSKPQANVLTSFIRFYLDEELNEQACDLYERGIGSLSSPSEVRAVTVDARLEKSLMAAAIKIGRSRLASGLLSATPSDVSNHIAMIRSCATAGNLKGAMDVFETLERNQVELNRVTYNTVLDACVECHNLKAAEEWMQRIKTAGMADVVSYNTLIKAYLATGNFEKARSMMNAMSKEGHQPNRVTFNQLINSTFAQRDRNLLWSLIDEMQAAAVKPNRVTCSILLKRLNANSAEAEILKTMDLITNMDEGMDEVLLSSVVEACVRLGKPELVAQKLSQLGVAKPKAAAGSNPAPENSLHGVSGSHTFGSLIKAYGYAKDMDGVWRCWREMRTRQIRPTSVTLGCMVEAVVNNGDPEGAYDLVHEMHGDPRCREALNAVIYCSVMKGFARDKKVARAFTVYEEMRNMNIELSIVTFNTLIDACARCACMERVPDLVANMKSLGIQLNVITYSTMLKGHCQMGEIQTAFALLKQMKTESNLTPDEIMYNSLLDGCAQSNLYDQGLRLMNEMQETGIIPSNFTLSVLVKLMGRARRLDGAFQLVQEISTKYKFKLNVHVYTNLIQQCISNKSLSRAMTVLEEMVASKVYPEARTYSILIRACLTNGRKEQAAALLRGALGLPGTLPFISLAHQCHNIDNALVNEALMGLAGNKDLALALVADIKTQKPKVRIDASTQRRLMCASADAPSAESQWRRTGVDTRRRRQ